MAATPRVPVGTVLYRWGYRPLLRYEAHTPAGLWLREKGGSRVWRKVGSRGVWSTPDEALLHLLARKRWAVRFAREALERAEAALAQVQAAVSGAREVG